MSDEKTNPNPVDQYDGKRKEGHGGVGDEQKYGSSQNPVQNPPAPWSNLREIGATGGQK